MGKERRRPPGMPGAVCCCLSSRTLKMLAVALVTPLIYWKFFRSAPVVEDDGIEAVSQACRECDADPECIAQSCPAYYVAPFLNSDDGNEQSAGGVTPERRGNLGEDRDAEQSHAQKSQDALASTGSDVQPGLMSLMYNPATMPWGLVIMMIIVSLITADFAGWCFSNGR